MGLWGIYRLFYRYAGPVMVDGVVVKLKGTTAELAFPLPEPESERYLYTECAGLHLHLCIIYISVPLIRVRPPGYFIHIPVTTPIAFALKNCYNINWTF